MDQSLTARIWERLLSNASLDDLGLGTVDGRIDLRGLKIPKSIVAGEMTFAGVTLQQRTGLTRARDVYWKGLDLSNSDLRGLMFFNSRIEDCRFDGALCNGLAFFGVHVTRTRFRGARLRDARMTTASHGLWNRFEDVDFEHADLRGSFFLPGMMLRCSFENARLDHVEFHGTVLEDCVFAGHLNCVCFYRHYSSGQDLPPNEMKNVDFRRATFSFVGFRKLDLETVQWPDDPDHVLLDDFPAALDRMIAYLEARDLWLERGALGLLGSSRKWLGANQRRGMMCKGDFTFLFGRAKTFYALLEVARGRSSAPT